VLARTVADAAVALDVIAGYEPGDHHYLPPPSEPFGATAGRPPRATAVRLALSAPLGVPVDPEPLAAAELAARALADLGHEVSEQAPAWDDDGFPAAWATLATGTIQHLIRVIERLHGRPVDPDRLEPATCAWALESTPIGLADYLEAAERLWAFTRRLLGTWPPGSVLLTPTLTRLPAEIDTLRSAAGVTDDALRFSALVRIWNVTGQPAITVPLHATPDGIPVGVQLVGPPGRDDLALSLAGQLEAAIGRHPAGIATPVAAYAQSTT
jgi:amidase